jgi:undecaprenyl-phosphate 4-deoxy-4-formamido-L-arabinose transferase
MRAESGAKPSLSVVIPVYNSEGSLRSLVDRLDPVLSARGAPFEIVLVNDGSRDRSWAIVSELARKHAFVRGINLMRNYGQHNALLCGIRSAENDVILTMDDDLQHPPEEIEMLLGALGDDVDVVYGTPKQEPHGLLRGVASRLTKMALQRAMGAETARKVSALRAFRTHLREAFEGYRSPHVSVDILLTWATTRFSSVVVRHDERAVGASNYSLRMLFTHAINMVTGFSTLPLRMASWIGFAFTLFGIGVLGFVLSRYLMYGSVVQGFPFLASLIAIFSGAQLFALGIIGEYLARMHVRMMDRPAYAVRSQTTEHD